MLICPNCGRTIDENEDDGNDCFCGFEFVLAEKCDLCGEYETKYEIVNGWRYNISCCKACLNIYRKRFKNESEEMCMDDEFLDFLIDENLIKNLS